VKATTAARRGLAAALGPVLLALSGVGCGPPPTRAEARPATTLEAGGRVSFASFSHTCAIVAGEVQCWGAGGSGQLGDGQMIRRAPLPARVRGLPGNATALAAGGSHTCAIVDAGAYCWGDNTRGQGGVERPLFLLSPGFVPSLPGPVTALAAGTEHSCAVSEGAVWCWGRNEVGEAGAPPQGRCRETHAVRPCSTPPVRVEGIEGRATAVSLGARHGCALAEGAAWCWGEAAQGQLGDGTHAPRSRPARVVGLPTQITALALGQDHGCALAEQRVWCWGAGSRGQQGDGALEDRPLPHRVEVPEAGLGLLAAGGDRSCAAGERVWCWGDGETVAVPVDGVSGPVRALAVGVDHVCAAELDGRVRCWGDNDYGQLGSGDAPRDHPTPVSVAAWDDGRLRDRDADGRLVVVCLGDSNTARRTGAPASWCERLGGMLPGASWQIVNRGLGGATAVPDASLLRADEPLVYALENDAPDAVILAYGTNDVLADAAVEEIVAAYRRLARRAREAGVVPFVALTPPLQPASSAANVGILALNRALREAFEPARIIDFHAGFDPAHFGDRLHLNESGQVRRARLAADALARALDPAVDP
jgi:alpha-tubulin suppressor-like RCC1 family protein/lysophospholipase L1-like esterase